MAKKKNKLLSGYYDANTGTRITNANIVEDSSGWKIEKNKLDNLNTSTTLSSKEPTSKVRSKVMAPAPQVKMTIDSINNKINTNINQKIINGGIENEIHNMNMKNIGKTSLDKNIDLSGKSVMGKTTPVDTSDFIYNDTGKKYGDYYYDNYELYKDMPIYEQHGKYYLKTNKGYEELGRLDKNGNVAHNVMTTKKTEKEELEKAKKLGFKDNNQKITSQEYDDAQDTFKELQKEYKLSDKELNNWIKTGELDVSHISIQTNKMNSLKQKAEDYRTKINSGEIKQYDQQGFDVNNQIYIDTHDMSDDEKQHYISIVTGKKDPTLKNENTFFKGSSVFDDGYQFGDVSKATLGTVGNAGYSFLKGTSKFVEGTSDFAENLIGSGLESFASEKDKKDVKTFHNNTMFTGYKYGNKDYWYDEKSNKLYDKDWNRVYDFDINQFQKKYTYSNKVAEFGRQMKEQTVPDESTEFFDEILHGNDLRKASVLGTKSEAMLESMGQAVPLMGAGGSVEGLLGSKAAVATTSGLTFASTYGNAKTEAIRNGATEDEAIKSAFIQASAETISEQFFDSIPGAKSAGWGEKLVGKVGNSVEKYMGSRTAKIVTKALDISGEGFEEIISNMLTAGGNDIIHFIDKDFTYGMENQTGNILDDMTKAMTSQDSMDSFISAIMTSAILNAGSTKINSSNENQIINEIVRTYAKEYNMSIDEAKSRLKINGDNVEFDTKNISQTQNTSNLPNNSTVEQRNINNNINNQVSENVQNSMVRTQNNNKVNPPISTTFLNSAKENNYNSNSEVIRNANSIMLKRGIEGRFDSKFFTNNSENALWRKDENGKRSVIFNPNADENAIFQNVVIHEMVHDVLSSKNNADVLNVEDILDFVSKTSGYESARMNLEETYSKVYDRNSDQFKEMVDEEVIATVLGNKLGSQEYINRLNGQKPNLARRIYNWIVNKLDSLSKALGHQSEKAYWRDVANRFEKAFNGEYNSDLNDNTKYMMTSVKGMNNGINTDNKNFNTYQKYKNGIEEPDNSSFSLKEQVEIARKEFMDSKEKYGFDEKTKELQKKYNKLLTKLNQTENPVQKDTRPQIEKDVDGIVKDLLRTMDQDIIDDQFIDEAIGETKYYKDNYIDETDEDILEELGIDQDEAERRNRELNDEIYDKLMNKLKDEGISIRYDKNGNAIYDRQELAIKGYNELLDYLDDKNINYEVSRSSEAGYVPSIYIKNSDGEVILRIANHKNHNLSDYDIQVDEKYNKLFSDKEYANWKEKIVPKIEENFEKFEWYDKDNQKYSQKSQTWDEFVENNFKSSGTRTKFSEIKAPINPNAITNQNKINPPIAKEYQKNTIEEKKSSHEDVIRVQAEEIANQLNSGKPLNTKERRWIETSIQSDVLKEKIFKEDLDVHKINYEVQSNKKSLKQANNKIDLLGYDGSINYVKDLINNGRIPTATDVAIAQRTLQEAVKKGDTEIAQNLVMDVAILGTELGQATQALSMINKLTPEGQLKLYSKIVHRAKMMGDKSFQDVEITPEMVEMILNAYDKNGNYNQDDLNSRVEQFKQKVADQLKSSVEEKIDAWRYLSMLGNPKTHIRNIVSNIAMKGAIAYKNAIARTIETFAPINTRTKTWKKASPEIKQYAKNTAIEMKNIITGESKYGEKASLESKKRIFKLAPLEAISNFNSNALEVEDWFFSKRAFINTFQEYLTANGINTMEDIQNNPDIVEKGKTYAVEQAEIATFRQYSKLASAINKIERNNKVAKYVIKATIPFKKTPINVAKAGVKYSPLGLIKNVTYDVYQVKKGNINASQFIDNLSQGLSGTSLTLLGYALAKAGILTGANGDDKDDKYDSYLGKQGYSIKIGNKYYSLSWLSPTAMPMFVGANIYEQFEDKKGWDMNVLSESLAKTLDPLNEMSFVSSLTDALNSYGSGNDKIKGMGESVVQSYIGQFFPTLFSQFANVGDDTKRSTKASSNSSYKFGEQTIRSIMYKIPGLRNKLESSTDIWGNEIKQNENILMRALESFILPYSAKEYKNSSIDKEIKKVYNDVGNTDVIPGFPQSYVKYDKVQYRMSAKEYTKFKKTYGTSANTMLNMLTNTSNYKNSTGKRKTRMIKKVYDYSREISKEEFLSNRKIDYDKNDFKYNKNDYEKIVNYITSSTQYKDDD